MFGEIPHGEFGRMLLFVGAQRGGADGGPVCRFVLNSRSGALLDLGRIDCFAVEPHHHTELPRFNPETEYPEEIRRELASRGQRLTAAEWTDCAHRALRWLREEFVAELAAGGWGEWVHRAAARELPAFAAAAEEFLLAHPPSGLAVEVAS